MALFGFGREPEPEAPTARELAEKHYRKLESEFAAQRLTLHTVHPAPPFSAESYFFAREQDEFLFLPALNIYGATEEDEFAAQRLTLHTVHPAPPFSAESYFFAREQDEFLFLPALNIYGATEEELKAAAVLRYPAARLTIAKDEPQRVPVRREGILDVYPIEPVTLRISVDGGEPLAFTAGNVESTAKFLSRYLPDCALRGMYDILQYPEDAAEVHCKKGGGLLPDGARFRVWREGDVLCFLRQNANLYQRTGDVQYGVLPLSAIESFGQEGAIRYETRVSGGEVTIDRSAAYWSGWAHPFTFNPIGHALEDAVSSTPVRSEQIPHDDSAAYWSGWAHPFTFNPIGHALEDAVSSTPVRSEQIPHDERYIELRVRWNGQRVNLEFHPKAEEIFRQLIPEKSEENLVMGREPTIPEQIEILANICDRGYLTREEFEEAKQKLLKKL